MDSCSIGICCNQAQDCHKTTYTRKIGLKKLHELPDDERNLILQRISIINPVPEMTVCFHHEQIFFPAIYCSSKVML